MKYFLTFILLLIILGLGPILEIELPIALNIGLVFLVLLTEILWKYSILNKNFEADFKMRSQKKTFELFELFNAIFYTLLLWFGFDNDKKLIFLIFIFWTLPLSELIILFIYKKKKPFTVFIKDNELILNKRWIQKRNLTELTHLRFNRFNKNLKLDFKSKSEVSIKTTEYKTDEIQTLLEILIEKSENNILVPNNYELKIKNSS